MNKIEDIFSEYSNSWLECLPLYQQKVINELYQQSGDYEQVAQAWLSASMPNNVPFGTEKHHSIFYEKILDEIEAFFSGDERLQTATFCGQQGRIFRTVRAILNGQPGISAGQRVVRPTDQY